MSTSVALPGSRLTRRGVVGAGRSAPGKHPRRWLFGLVGAVCLAAAVPAQAAPFVYVTNGQGPPRSLRGGAVFEYDAAAGGLVALSAVGTRAQGGAVAVTPDGTSVYVTNPNVNTVSQYDVAADGTLTPKTAATVAAGSHPSAIAVTPDAKAAYVTNALDNTVSQYDIGPGGRITPTIPATVATGRVPSGIAVSPDGQSVYVTNLRDDTVSQYSVGAGEALTPKTPATVATGGTPDAIAVSPDGKNAYVTNSSGGTVSQYDVGTGGELTPKTLATVATGPFPIGIAVSPDNKSVYVPRSNGLVVEYAVSSGGLALKTPATVAAGNAPSAIAVSPDGGSVYVTNSVDGTVSQYAAGVAFTTLTPWIPATVAAGLDPLGIAVGPTHLVFHCTSVFSPCSLHIQPLGNSVRVIATIVRANTSQGILVERIVGQRRIRVGRVPFGPHPAGRLRIRWDLRVGGHKLPKGRYLITLRAFDHHQHLITAAHPVEINLR